MRWPVLSVTDLEMEVGDTTGAFPHGIVNDACSVHPQSRGLFYQVIGTGDAMDVTLSITELAEDYRLELAVIESSCQTGECVASSDFLTADDETETITFQTQPDLVYYVAVTGERFEDVGKFEIVLTVSKVGWIPYFVFTHSFFVRIMDSSNPASLSH